MNTAITHAKIAVHPKIFVIPANAGIHALPAGTLTASAEAVNPSARWDDVREVLMLDDSCYWRYT